MLPLLYNNAKLPWSSSVQKIIKIMLFCRFYFQFLCFIVTWTECYLIFYLDFESTPCICTFQRTAKQVFWNHVNRLTRLSGWSAPIGHLHTNVNFVQWITSDSKKQTVLVSLHYCQCVTSTSKVWYLNSNRLG